MGAIWQLAAACGAFAATHYLLSHPLRRPLVKCMGERGFLGLYSLIAIAALAWMAIAYHRAPAGPALWNGFALVPWLITSLLTLPALTLVLTALRGNPALPQAQMAGLSTRRPWRVFRLTRHPMMMGFALWAVSHLIVAPTVRSAILSLTIGGVALGGAALQDRKKLARFPREWNVWMSRTRFWPDPRQLGALSDSTWAAGIAAWLGATALHWWLTGIPAGVWRLVDVGL